MKHIAVLITFALLLGLASAAYAKKGGGGKPGGGGGGGGGIPDADVTLLHDQGFDTVIWKGDDAGAMEPITGLSGLYAGFGPAGTSQMVLLSDVNGWGVYVANDLSGAGLRKVVGSSATTWTAPVWSNGATPNGKDMIAYIDEEADTSRRQLFVTTPAGEVTQLTFGTGHKYDPSWNPATSDQIVVRGYRVIWLASLAADAAGDLYVASSEMITAGTQFAELSLSAPSFSPDGKRIAFSAMTGPERQMEVWTYQLATKSFTNLTNGAMERDSVSPAICKDGKVVFVHPSKNQWALWIMDADGSNIRLFGNTKRRHPQHHPAARP